MYVSTCLVCKQQRSFYQRERFSRSISKFTSIPFDDCDLFTYPFYLFSSWDDRSIKHTKAFTIHHENGRFFWWNEKSGVKRETSESENDHVIFLEKPYKSLRFTSPYFPPLYAWFVRSNNTGWVSVCCKKILSGFVEMMSERIGTRYYTASIASVWMFFRWANCGRNDQSFICSGKEEWTSSVSILIQNARVL